MQVLGGQTSLRSYRGFPTLRILGHSQDLLYGFAVELVTRLFDASYSYAADLGYLLGERVG